MTTETKKPDAVFLTIEEMAAQYPLLTVLFDVASDTLKQTPMTAEQKAQFKQEMGDFFKVMKSAFIRNADLDSMTEEEQQAEWDKLQAFIYLGSFLKLFVRKVAAAPILEKWEVVEGMESKED